MAELAPKYHLQVLRRRSEGETTREIGRRIKKSFSAVAAYLRSPDGVARLAIISEERDRAVGHRLADGAVEGADWLRSVVRGKTKTGKVIKASIAEKTRAAMALLDRSNHAPGVKVTVDATVRAVPIDDADVVRELAELLEMQVVASEPLAITEAEEVH